MALKFRCSNCNAETVAAWLEKGQTAKCRHCGAEVTIPDDAETVKQSEVDEYFQSTRLARKPPPPVRPINESRYPALVTIISVYRVLAVIVGVLTVLGFLYGAVIGALGNLQVGGIIIIYSLIWGFVTVVSLLAFAELIKLLIDVESNTNLQNELLRKLINKIDQS